MTTYRLFPSTNGPATSAAPGYASNFISGVLFAVSGGVQWFQGYWVWINGQGVTTPVKCALWSATSLNTGVVVPGSVVTSGTMTLNAWNYVPLPTPIQLAPGYDPNQSSMGSAYVAAVGINGPFSDTNSYWNSGDTAPNGIVNGPLVAYSGKTGTKPAPYTLQQGVFTTAGSDPSVTMPNGADSGGDGASNFWVDVQISDTAPGGYSGSYRLWPNKYDTNPGTGTDSTIDYVIATEVHLSTAVTMNNVWYYSPPGTAQRATWVGVYQITGADSGTLVGVNTTPTWSGAAASGWISAPITGVIGPGSFKVCIYNNNASPDAWGPKDATSAYYDLGVAHAGITAGPLSAPQLSAASNAYLYNGVSTTTPPYTNGTILPGQPTFAQPASAITLPAYPYLYAPVTADTDPSNAVHTQNYWIDLEVTANIVTISVSDNAGGVESRGITVSAALTDVIAAVENSQIPSIALNFVDVAGVHEFLVTPGSPTMTKVTVIAIGSLVRENSSFTSSVAAGKPYQGNMRQLALDRWNYMYPS